MKTSWFSRLANIRVYRRDSYLLWEFLGVLGISIDAETDPDPQLLNALMESYTSSRQTAARYCKGLNVQCSFFIQPLLSNKKRRSFTERRRLQRDLLLLPGYSRAYELYTNEILKAFPTTVDLRHVFDEIDETIFHDIVHPNTDGKRILAYRLGEFLLKH